ncbi:MAG: undecaprenyl/decaprenyl-phosphate alpha-N-acetylglucosaminyl 1-phosphate transferase [Lachnoclostridium sp.]|nr:undecaprenyl/decaprenyl-phosphate alpha-N-acetylglucosaminyl 1-phosphate transferase [Lachnoclostridium sp.]
MNIWAVNIFSVFIACILLTGVLIPQILLIAFRRKLFDEVNERKVHKGTIPRLGGIAFEPVIFFSMFAILGANILLGYDQIPDTFHDNSLLLAASVCALQLLYLVGIADDLIGIKYRAKFVVQLVCAILLIAGGTYFSSLDGIFGIDSWPLWIAYPFTAIVAVFIINAINLIDGIDGLASGLSSIATIIYGVSFFIAGQYFLSMISFATLGVLIPFYYYNVFGNAERHSKIFMGDTGSLTIGIMLFLLGTQLFSIPEPIYGINPAVIAFSPLVIPCFDVIRVYVFRIRHHSNPFTPDRNHIHHRLLQAGFTQRIAMVSIVLFSLLLCLFNIVLSLYININYVVLADILIWMVLIKILSVRIQARRQSLPSEATANS